MTAQQPDPEIQEWIGQHVGNYRLVRLLGEGGMGMVFEGVHDGVGGRAAIKILRPEIAKRADVVARFFNEARAANASQHPGIVHVFDSGYTHQGAAFLSMEYLDGESLRSRLARMNQLPLRDALRISRQIASALLAAHRKNIVHRDLKPDNIMIVPDPDLPGGERVKVLDFGIAKIAESLGATPLHTGTGLLMGTPAYMSPEQCRGAKGVTDRSDVYSLGIILYKMLAGRPPFISGAAGELIAMHLMDPVPPLSELAPQVGAPLAALVHSMLEKTQALRPAMDKVVESLQRLEKYSSPSEDAIAAPAGESTQPVSINEVEQALRAPPLLPPIAVAPPHALTTRQKDLRHSHEPMTMLVDTSATLVKGLTGPRLWGPLAILGGACVFGAIVLVVQLRNCAKPPATASARKEQSPSTSTSVQPANGQALHPFTLGQGSSSTASPDSTLSNSGTSPLTTPLTASDRASGEQSDRASSDPCLAVARKALKGGHYSEAIDATSQCSKDSQLQATRIRAMAACHIGDLATVQHALSWLRASKSHLAHSSILEIQKECDLQIVPKISVMKLDSRPLVIEAERYYRVGNYQQAQSTAEQFKDADPLAAWSIIGRASCRLGDTAKALNSLHHLEVDPAKLLEVKSACEALGYLFRDGQLRKP